jgi:parallel beta-helix repeat protein
MRSKFVLALGLTFVLLGLLGVAVKVERIDASGTIYIRANGSVEGTDKIASADNITYALTGNISDSIVVERSNITIDGNGYTVQGSGSGNGFYWYDINNVTVKNTDIRDFASGVYFELSENSTVSGNTITNSTMYGVMLWLSDKGVAFGNTITNSTYGVYLWHSNGLVSGNTITNIDRGVYLFYSNNVTVSGNTITDDTYGVVLDNSDNSVVSGNSITNSTIVGVDIDRSDNGVISGNSITNSTNNGVSIWSSNNGLIFGNTITDSNYGVYLDGASSNKIYHNNFIDNQYTAYASTDSLNNVWDDGYPSGGNYWSGYSDVDIYSGPYQNQTGSDGIWDHPYVINANNKDNYPIVSEFSLYLMIPLFLIATLLAVIIFKRKHLLMVNGG